MALLELLYLEDESNAIPSKRREIPNDREASQNSCIISRIAARASKLA